MRPRPWHFLLASSALIAAAAGWAWSDRCGEWTATAPRLVASGGGAGELRAGAARAALAPPFPIVVAGYAPPRPEASSAARSLQARALVLEAGNVKVAILSVDLLTVPADVANRVRERVEDLGLSELWLAATHAHSSFGGYDARAVSEIAGTGAFRVEARAAVVEACVRALRSAARAVRPAELEVGEAERPELSRARTGASVDPRITRVRVRAPDAPPIAEMWLLAAHPTLAPRERDALSPDYPGWVEGDDAPVTLVLQGAVGNAAAVAPEGSAEASERFAGAVRGAFQSVSIARVDSVAIAFSRVVFGLPRPDARRLVPAIARGPAENLLCGSAERTAVISVLRLGPLTWIALPLEPTADAARAIEAATGARPIALVGGYLGYVDGAKAVSEGGGESRRQYFGPQLLEAIERAGSLATSALGRR
ncbi:MAG TPA: neutral/alkaline non-lysosomal ceramidase N-terminal domain-containing protein [Myxococcaceae bacterium]|nr:neutral/alkaline non-lysosomal ceramidase N-terminal domain-containing protein [Myxococcaceae bacterium]